MLSYSQMHDRRTRGKADQVDEFHYHTNEELRRAWEHEHDRRTNYQRGADFERMVRDHLIHDLDAKLVVRSAGSHGVADLVALFAGEEHHIGERDMADEGEILLAPTVWIVQAKKDGKLSLADEIALLNVAAETGAIPYLAWHVLGHGVRMTLLREE